MTIKTEKQKMLSGEAYRPGDPELAADAQRAREWMVHYNTTLAASPEERRKLLRELLAHVGEDAVIRPPFFCDYGQHISLGDGVFLNFNCVILDVAPVSIGALTQVGSGVQFLTADHPRDPELRRAGVESGLPITVGANVWIGAGALLLPGINVGDDAIIGAGAVVTRDVPAGATVVGNPARQRPKV